MNLRPRHGIAALTLALATVASVPAFAQSYGHYDGYNGRPVATPVYTQATVTAPVAIAPAAPVFVAPAPMAQPVVIQNQAPIYAQSAIFAARTRERMNQIEREAREGVARGLVRPQIFGALRDERAQIEATLARTVARNGGMIRPFAAQRVEAMLAEMNGLRAQFQVPTHGWGRRDERDGRGFEHRGNGRDERDGRGPVGRY